ncbi:MAG: 16S rRNA (cytosine(1402)-N(4))-methyltransferase RsmH [Myxococcota bacterium]|nr:16S rRNA (cytosine(1402)-N(4))-methyltransferase RsmH [Myxococcota bacterium]
MSGFAHASVLADETIELLAPREHGVYVDGTLGGGGHAAALLTQVPTVTVIGIDRDPLALAAAGARLAPFGDRARLIHGEYADIPAILAELSISQVHGIVLDLGVSSPQLDLPERGFSFSREGPLDMRMDPTRGPTALQLIRETDVDDLANLIYELGEERHSKKVARLIKEALLEDKLATTTDLAAVVARAIPTIEQRKSKIHPATRTFQALRIAVNAELEQLEHLLATFPDRLVTGGRCAIISFHSLEDRLVKNRFRDLAWTSSLPPKFAAQAGERIEPVCALVTRKAVVAADAEIARNPRARSARLRVCERTSAPNVPATLVGPVPTVRPR